MCTPLGYRSPAVALFLVAAAVVVVFASAASLVGASTFIWDPASNATSWRLPSMVSASSPGRCVPIPANLTLCHGIKYSQMRLPNLLHHDTLGEAIQQSETWLPLTQIMCHPDTQLFLCSLFTPVCLDQTIPPCRSLCESVKAGCEGYMRAKGYSWPMIINCQQFPIDNNMCIQSQALMAPAVHPPPPPFTTHPASSSFSPPRSPPVTTAAAAVDKVEDEANELEAVLLSTMCTSDWVIKSSINAIRNNQVRIHRYKVLHGAFTHTAPVSLSLNQTNIINTGSNMTTGKASSKKARKPKYLIIGIGGGGGGGADVNKALVTKMVVNWHVNPSLIKRTLKRIGNTNVCNKFKTSSTTSTSTSETRSEDRKRKRGGNRKHSRTRPANAG